MRRRGLATVLVLGALLGLVSTEPPQALAQDQAAINNAVAKGVAALRQMQGAGGAWSYQGFNDPQKDPGATALAGLALLASEVPKTDPAVTSAAKYVAMSAPALTEVYSIGLAIMFLDAYGIPGPIRALADKLLKAQCKNGTWGYGLQGGAGGSGQSDNSNTQFAILGLWAARKHGVNVDAALKKTEKHFRETQGQDGGWSYGLVGPQGDPNTPTMTCAGLLGLFLGFGNKKEKEATLRASAKGDTKPSGPDVPVISLDDIRSDPQVVSGFRFIGQYVGTNLQGVGHWLYFVWSVERVGVIYEVKDFNGKDWYAWGADVLVRSQRQDGKWIADNGPVVDTAFSLLFLRKANLVGKLGETELRASRDGKATPTTPKAGGGPSATKNEPVVEDKTGKLAQELIRASGAKQSQLIEDYKSTSGAEYTDALAQAIPRLSGGTQTKARQALAERLGNRGPNTLTNCMESDDRELRLAAAIGAGLRGKDDVASALIALLKDRDNAISSAAYDSLKSISGKSFDKDPAAWESWLKSKSSK